MPTIYDEATMARLYEWAANHRADYIASGGVRGHIMDQTFLGGHRYEPMLLLRYQGRKSGRTMVTALGYAIYNGEVIIAGSKGGDETNPAWYHNILAGGPLAFQVATQAFEAEWRELDGEEYEDAWRYMENANPIFTGYRQATTRKIPLIALKALGEIPVFTDPDA